MGKSSNKSATPPSTTPSGKSTYSVSYIATRAAKGDVWAQQAQQVSRGGGGAPSQPSAPQTPSGKVVSVSGQAPAGATVIQGGRTPTYVRGSEITKPTGVTPSSKDIYEIKSSGMNVGGIITPQFKSETIDMIKVPTTSYGVPLNETQLGKITKITVPSDVTRVEAFTKRTEAQPSPMTGMISEFKINSPSYKQFLPYYDIYSAIKSPEEYYKKEVEKYKEQKKFYTSEYYAIKSGAYGKRSKELELALYSGGWGYPIVKLIEQYLGGWRFGEKVTIGQKIKGFVAQPENIAIGVGLGMEGAEYGLKKLLPEPKITIKIKDFAKELPSPAEGTKLFETKAVVKIKTERLFRKPLIEEVPLKAITEVKKTPTGEFESKSIYLARVGDKEALGFAKGTAKEFKSITISGKQFKLPKSFITQELTTPVIYSKGKAGVKVGANIEYDISLHDISISPKRFLKGGKLYVETYQIRQRTLSEMFEVTKGIKSSKFAFRELSRELMRIEEPTIIIEKGFKMKTNAPQLEAGYTRIKYFKFGELKPTGKPFIKEAGLGVVDIMKEPKFFKVEGIGGVQQIEKGGAETLTSFSKSLAKETVRGALTAQPKPVLRIKPSYPFAWMKGETKPLQIRTQLKSTAPTKTNQKQLLVSTTDIKEQLKIRERITTRTTTRQGQEGILSFKQIMKPIEITRQEEIIKPIQLLRPVEIQRQKQIQRFQEISIGSIGTEFPISMIGEPISPIIPPFKFPSLPQLDLFGERRGTQTGRRKYKYTPSLVAVYTKLGKGLGMPRRMKGEAFTGLELRPMLKLKM